MRWPPAASPRKDGCPIDQETVNGLIDHAIERGINYFDTAPIYGQGWSETVTGRALKRHPREKFLIATKMSGASDLSRENLTAMYRRSFQNLQVDYIDYYLLHGIGGGGIQQADSRASNQTRGRLKRLGASLRIGYSKKTRMPGLAPRETKETGMAYVLRHPHRPISHITRRSQSGISQTADLRSSPFPYRGS